MRFGAAFRTPPIQKNNESIASRQCVTFIPEIPTKWFANGYSSSAEDFFGFGGGMITRVDSGGLA